MKELTIEEKANAYDNVRNKIAARFGNNVAQEIFSEYEESEDEKIRKSIIRCLKGNMPDNDYRKEYIAWLEKQVPKVLIGARKDVALSIMNFLDRNTLGMDLSGMERADLESAVMDSDWSKVYDYMKKKLEKQGHTDGIIEKAKTEKQRVIITETDGNANIGWDTRSLEDARKLLECGLQYVNTELEKQRKQKYIDDLTQQEAMDIAVAKCFEQGGQKPVDKVEPKFHEGDWIVFNGLTLYIIEVVNYIKQSVKGFYRTITIDGIHNSYDWDIDNAARLWTIQDAKDGDVLCVKYGNDEMPFIFTGKQDDVAYCALNSFGEFVLSIAEWLLKTSVLPATKEQRNMLFQKIHEAGYTFDFEKKELKKIEPLTDFEKAFQGMCCDKNKQFAKECCKTLLELAKKQLQSKRNEFELDEISYKVGVKRVLENPESYGLTKNRLKLSTSDIKALEDIMNDHGNMNGHGNTAAYYVLRSIINQLKTPK